MLHNKIRLEGLSTIDLPLVGLARPSDKYITKNIDGLGPTENDVAISRGFFQKSTPRERLVIAQIGLNPDWTTGETPSDLREHVYGLITGGYTGTDVSVVVMNGDVEICRTDGARVSKCEPPMFSKDPEVVVTLECLGPYFYQADPYEVDLTALSVSTPSFLNIGSAPTGLHMKMTFVTGFSDLTIWSAGDRQHMTFDPYSRMGFSFETGDILEFDTTENNRYARLWQLSDPEVPVDILAAMTDDSEWIQLYGGMNSFTLDPAPPVVISWDEISYRPQYLGV